MTLDELIASKIKEAIAKDSADRLGMPTHCARCCNELGQAERFLLGEFNGVVDSLCIDCHASVSRSGS